MTPDPSAGRVPLDTLLEHRAWVRALARTLASDPHRAEDVEQETWRMAIERPPRHAGSLRAWFGTVVRNAARSVGRSEASRARREAASRGPAPVQWPDDLVAEAEVQHRLVRAVLELDEPYRSTVLARYFDGLEATEIAAKSGVPVETVRTRLKRGIERLRERLGVELGDDRDAWCLLLLGHRAVPRVPGPHTARDAAPHAPVGAPLGPSAALTGAAGGVAMGAAAKLAVGAVVLVFGAFIAWTFATAQREDALQGDSGRGASNRTGTRAPRARLAPAADAAATEPSPDAPDDPNAADRDLDLHGVVVDPEGAPIAGAELTAIDYPWRRVFLLNMDSYDDGRPGPSTRSAADGGFRLRLARGAEVSLSARAPGFADAEFQRLQAGERIRLVLPRAVRLVVRVKDESGAPVADAAVEVNLRPRAGLLGMRRHAKSSADGTAIVAGLPGGTSPWISAEHTDRGRAWTGAVALPASGDHAVDMTLPKGRTVTGRVTDATTGAAVAGARIGIDWTLAKAVTSGADGRYELAGWTGESKDSLVCLAEGYGRATCKVDGTKDADFALVPGDAIVGRVVDAAGAPIAGAIVAAMASRGYDEDQEMSTASVETGADGRFRLPNLRRDLPHGLVAIARGHGRRAMDVAPSPPPHAARDVGDFALPDARTVEVRVVGVDAKPLARHVVTLKAEELASCPGYGADEARVTDDLGRARFPDLGPGRYTVEVAEPEDNRVTRIVSVGITDPEPVVISFAASRAVRVRVVDDTGAAVAGFHAQVEFDGAPPQSRATAADGSAEFASDAPVERISLFGQSQAARRDYLPPEPPPVRPGQTDWTIVVRRAAHISGRVVDPSGAPLANASVCARIGAHSLWADQSAADGTFRIALPADVTVDVVFEGVFPRHDGPLLAGEILGVAPGATNLVLATRECALDRTLRVRVEDPTGTPVVGAKVLALVTGVRKYETATTDATGVALIEHLADAQTFVHLDMAMGTYAWTTRWARPRVTSVLRPAGQEITLRLLEAVHLRGKVLDPAGKPAAGVYVDALGPGFANGKTSETGAFDLLIPRDEPGVFQIMARLHEGRTQVASAHKYNVRPEDGEIVIRLVAK